MSYNPNGYNQNGTDMITWFRSFNQFYSNTPNTALTTNFKINNIDISNNYTGILTNSNIPVSTLYDIGYYINNQSIGDLFELNLVNISYFYNSEYKYINPSGNNGLILQILYDATFSFNYNIDCSFVMVGGGGAGGDCANNNAGGGGGAGELIIGSIYGYIAGTPIIINTAGSASPPSNGDVSTITYGATTITANGGSGGGSGKGSSNNTTGSSSGGSGSYSSGSTSPGTVTPRTIPDTSIFKYMTSFGNRGSQGNDQNNDSGAGGGGGGAGGASPDPGNDVPGVGGAGMKITFGTANIYLAGGGGGGARQNGYGTGYGGTGGSVDGVSLGGNGGGQYAYQSYPYNGYQGKNNTGSGGGGAGNSGGTGGFGGSGTVIFYILPSQVSLP